MAKRVSAGWQELYPLAARLDQLDPWSWMSVPDCFGVVGAGQEEPCFVIFGGSSKGFRNVRLLLGWKAMFDFVSRVADPAKQNGAWLLEIRMLELLYLEDRYLFESERSLLKRLRVGPCADGSRPVFRSIRPGYHPCQPDPAERALAAQALYQALGLALRVEEDGLLLKGRFPGEVLLRRQEGQGGAWRDVWTPAQAIPDEEVEVRIDGQRLRRLAEAPLRRLTIQVDLLFTPLRVRPKGRRPQTAYVLLLVDAASGLIVAGELLQALSGVPQMWAQIPERLLSVFEHLGGCPQVLEVSCDRMANLLRPLGEHLPFKMVRHERLEAVEAAKEHLEAFITGEGAALPDGSD